MNQPVFAPLQEVVGWLQLYFTLVVLLRLSHTGAGTVDAGAQHR